VSRRVSDPVTSSTWRKCQFCKEDAEGLVKYGVRHYAHAVCLYRKRGEAGLMSLSRAARERLPVIPLAKAGLPFSRLRDLLDDAERAEREAACARRNPMHSEARPSLTCGCGSSRRVSPPDGPRGA
jgi:hypothetical protein